MIRYFFGFTFGLLCCFGACKQKPTTFPEIETEDLVFKMDTTILDIKRVKFLAPSANARKTLRSFKPYTQLKSGLDSLNTTNTTLIESLVDEIYVRGRLMEDMLPKKLKTPAISARLKVLITQIGVVLMDYQNTKPTPLSIAENNQKIAAAYNNMILQINELHLEIPDKVTIILLGDGHPNDSIPLPEIPD